MTRIRSFFYMFVMLLSMTACDKEVENKYAGFPAYFVCKFVNTVPPLNSALNGMGIFTTIQYNRNQYLFKEAGGQTATVNATAVENYKAFSMGLAGFIVGLPNVPELNSNTSVPVCFDLACPNCYSDLHLERSLQLKTGGYAECTSCKRTYDLNNQGIVCIGNGGSSLFRYRVTYSPMSQTMIINNR